MSALARTSTRKPSEPSTACADEHDLPPFLGIILTTSTSTTSNGRILSSKPDSAPTRETDVSPTTSGKRQLRPNCVTEKCVHSLSFHGTELGPCRALGCNCAAYVGPTQLGFDTVTFAEAAELLGVADEDAVRELAVGNLELEWVPELMLDTRGSTEMVWRIKRSVIEAYLTTAKDS